MPFLPPGYSSKLCSDNSSNDVMVRSFFIPHKRNNLLLSDVGNPPVELGVHHLPAVDRIRACRRQNSLVMSFDL